VTNQECESIEYRWERERMNAIWKFAIIAPGVTELRLPAGARLLRVDAQRDEWGEETAQIWALVASHHPREIRRIHVYATGQEIEDLDRFAYVGTFQMCDDKLVWHVFEELAEQSQKQ